MNEVFASRLRELRARNNRNQKDMAQEMGISAAALSSYEKGQKSPPLDIAARIARAYGVSIDWLCGLPQIDSTGGGMKYSDAIMMLVTLVGEGILRLGTINSVMIGGVPCYDPDKDMDILVPYGAPINDFLSKWASIQNSLAQEVIDIELYQAWLEKQIRDNDKFIETNRGIGDAMEGETASNGNQEK